MTSTRPARFATHAASGLVLGLFLANALDEGIRSVSPWSKAYAASMEPSSAAGSFALVTVSTTTGGTLLTTGAGSILGGTGRRAFLDIENPTSAEIWCSFGSGASLILANLGIAQMSTASAIFVVPPLSSRNWSGTYVPADAVFCIASALTSISVSGG
jgi:hypothetical protein